ncbi:dTDP-4-dehydrorhamnose 3,5-epimerase [Vampirovibrio chlorellavorus]|uniref:dTDP-4-dehydrorhamnose 3,5-epimerase n=1 Tax=Vampirovibrio chlorellavorus TaxID=758823 RepID=UPI0026EBD487|nr:dTDP-4-dehydrorhamnose 3,5-epimerase [Vampirovibrio chlorellavorus]
MIFTPTPLAGAFVVDIEKLEDERGFFAEGWKDEVAAAHGISVVFNRTNISYNRKAGTVRGLHSQRAPYEEAKLVRCIQGAIFDVIVDIRPHSPTYLQWYGLVLSAENHRMLYMPHGFLHGFQTLVPDSTVSYQVAGTYQPQQEVGARFDDPAFGIDWPDVGERVLSPKDQAWPPFQPQAQAILS